MSGNKKGTTVWLAIGCNVPAQNTLILLNKNLKIYESILRRWVHHTCIFLSSGNGMGCMMKWNKFLDIKIYSKQLQITIFTYFNLFRDMFQITSNTYFILLRSFNIVSFSISARLVPGLWAISVSISVSLVFAISLYLFFTISPRSVL